MKKIKKHLKKNSRPCHAAALLALGVYSGVASAQDGDTDAHSSVHVLEEIVVTALRRSQDIQDVPASIVAFSGQAIEAARIRTPAELAHLVPNMQVNKAGGEGAPVFSLRGVSMADFNFNQNSPIATYVDEVYKGSPSIMAVQIYDLQRVEVLRGPQGTLYGKNTTGGAINFVSETPTSETEGYLTVGAGNYDLREARGAFNFAASDSLAFRLAGVWSEADGWMKNLNPGIKDGNAVDEKAARLSVLWQPRENLDLLLRASTGEAKPVSHGSVPQDLAELGIGGGVYQLYNAFGDATAPPPPTREGLDIHEFESDSDARWRHETDSVSLTLTWDLNEDYTLTSITSWDEGSIFTPEDADGNLAFVLGTNRFADSDQFTQDLRVTSALSGPFNFVAGLYYAEDNLVSENDLNLFLDVDLNLSGQIELNDCLDPLAIAQGIPPSADGAATEALFNLLGFSLGDFATFGCRFKNSFEQERTSAAAYFDGSYDLTDSLVLRLGLRYTDDESTLSGFNAGIYDSQGMPVVATIPADPVDPLATVPEESFSDSEVTGKIGIDYTFENGNLVYASFSQGYRGGAFNAQAYFDISELTPVDPEYLDSFEIGLKSLLWDQRLRLNTSAFLYQYKDQQFVNIDPVTITQSLINVDESEIYGFEIEASVLATPYLTIHAGLGYLHSEVISGMVSGQDITGNELPDAPGSNANVALQWTFLNTDLGSFTLYTDVSYVDERYYHPDNSENSLADAYSVVNMRLTLEGADSRWSVSLWGRNLGEEEYETTKFDSQPIGYNYTLVGAPLTYGAEFSFNF